MILDWLTLHSYSGPASLNLPAEIGNRVETPKLNRSHIALLVLSLQCRLLVRSCQHLDEPALVGAERTTRQTDQDARSLAATDG